MLNMINVRTITNYYAESLKAYNIISLAAGFIPMEVKAVILSPSFRHQVVFLPSSP